MKNLGVLQLNYDGPLMIISGHLEGHVSHKIAQYQKLYVYLNLSVYVYIIRSSIAIEMYGQPFFTGPSQHREYYHTL